MKQLAHSPQRPLRHCSSVLASLYLGNRVTARHAVELHRYSSTTLALPVSSSALGRVPPMALVGPAHWSHGGWLTHLKKSWRNHRNSCTSSSSRNVGCRLAAACARWCSFTTGMAASAASR